MTLAEQWKQEGLEKGLEKGRQEGREEGRLNGARTTLVKQITLKFGGPQA
jgi:flagellar biosynthesis/type III secretory pathway protein FliH